MNNDMIDLQTKQLFQEQLLEELNQVLTEQQQQIVRLENTMRGLKTQLVTLQSATEEPEIEQHEVPPHY